MRRIPFTATVATDSIVAEGDTRRSLSVAGGQWETPIPLLVEHGGKIAGEVTRLQRTKQRVLATGYIEDDDAPETKRLIGDIRAGNLKCSIRYEPLAHSIREVRGVGVQAVDSWRLVECSLTRRPADTRTSISLGEPQRATVAKSSTIHRAFSVLTIKRADDDARTIVGLATSPETDRMGDVVEPLGAEFKLPLPLLLHHDPTKPIGHVTKARMTGAGIEIEARILKSDTPGPVKDRLDGAWSDIKLGLVRGLSVGFKPLEVSRLKEGGLRFIRRMWLELSAVTIAANADASITAVKTAAGASNAPNGYASTPDALAVVGELGAVLAKRGRLAPETIGRGLAEMLRTFADPLADRIKRLEAEVQKCMRWRGAHVECEHYHRGDMVQRSGTVWVCERQTSDRPGELRSWRMLVKTPTRSGGQP